MPRARPNNYQYNVKKFSLVSNLDLAKINGSNLKALSPERQVKAIRMWADQNFKTFGSGGTPNTDQAMQEFIKEAGKHFKLSVENPFFLAALKLQKGWGTAKVLEGRLGKVTDEVWEKLPEELQKKLGTVLSNSAPPQGGQGIKQLAGSPKYKGVSYNFELKFLGAFGNHRCYGNQDGDKVKFTVYDPNVSLHKG